MSSRRTSIELCTVEEGRRVKGSYVKRDLAEDPRPSTSSSREEQGIDSHAQTAKVTDDQLEEKVLEDELKPQDIFATATSAATAVTGWDYVYGRLEKYDREMIKGYSEDIDNLLIFAGLFSAVLTAFLVEVYTQLQPDDTQLSIQLLYNISLQLQHISMNQAAPVSSNGPLTMPFYPGPRVVAINALWFLSLVLALASALLGIFVKQWLREYISWTSVSPIQHAIQLRKFRFDAFQRWKVPGIVTLVPGLLQLAVVLFFGGLVTLLWPINTVVSAACCAAAGTTIISAVLVVLMPLVFDSCPYKTPFAWMILPSIRPCYRLFRRCMKSIYRKVGNYDWNPCLYPIDDFFDRRRQSHADLYTFNGWAHRDMALKCFARDPLNSVAAHCYSLLWLTLHEDPGDGVTSQCISDLPGPPVRTRSAIERDSRWYDKRNMPKWPETLTSRVCGYWLAISELLGLLSFRSIPVLDILDNSCEVPFTDDRNDCPERPRAICDTLETLNDAQVRLMFKLLASGLDALFTSSLKDCEDHLFPRRSLPNLHINALKMMHLISAEHKIFYASCEVYILRTLSGMDQLSFSVDDRNRTFNMIHTCCESGLNRGCDAPAEDTAHCLELATSCYDSGAFREHEEHRDRFWAAVKCVTSLCQDSDLLDRSSESFRRLCTAMIRFDDSLIDALSLWAEFSDGQPTMKVDWLQLFQFLVRHKELAEERTTDVMKCVVGAYRRGFNPDGMLYALFVYNLYWDHLCWVDMNDAYKSFGFPPMPGNGGITRSSLGSIFTWDDGRPHVISAHEMPVPPHNGLVTTEAIMDENNANDSNLGEHGADALDGVSLCGIIPEGPTRGGAGSCDVDSGPGGQHSDAIETNPRPDSTRESHWGFHCGSCTSQVAEGDHR